MMLLALAACGDASPWGVVDLARDQDATLPDGGHYTPNTQSFLRGHHWLGTADRVAIAATEDGVGRLRLASEAGDQQFEVVNVDLRTLVPRLHYAPQDPPDAFDAMNLMLAEFSRNGLSFPYGAPQDSNPHFETSLVGEVPWKLRGPFDFEPDPLYRPLRFSVVNNCLEAGLWELEGTDRAGELYHGWLNLPLDPYFRLMAAVNGVPVDFARDAVRWRTDPVPADLDRLRTVKAELGTVAVRLAPDADVGYSSQSSRRKLRKNYAMLGEDEAQLRPPRSRSELTQGVVWMVDFQPPGRYAPDHRKKFDLRFLSTPGAAAVREVSPKTSYNAPIDAATRFDDRRTYLELDLDLGAERLVIGNLPLDLLVPEEDFLINGFGVGILDPGEPAERRALLVSQGPAPSYAYLIQQGSGQVLNSHERGVEQIFLRLHLEKDAAWWEVTVTSFERIIDLVKYEVPVPPALDAAVREAARRYVSPVYFTYQDDNLL